MDVIVNISLSHILFFNLAACSGEYSLFSCSCNRRFGGGHRRSTPLHNQHHHQLYSSHFLDPSVHRTDPSAEKVQHVIFGKMKRLNPTSRVVVVNNGLSVYDFFLYFLARKPHIKTNK